MLTEMKGSSASPVKPGEMERMSIERAANGFTLEVRRKMKPRKANELYDYDAGTERMVFNDVDAMCEQIKKVCGGKKDGEKKE